MINTVVYCKAFVFNAADQRIINNLSLELGENFIDTRKLAKGIYFGATEVNGQVPSLTKFIK